MSRNRWLSLTVAVLLLALWEFACGRFAQPHLLPASIRGLCHAW